MHPDQLILPSIATLILGTAILLPLRDTKREARGEQQQPVAELEWRAALDVRTQTCGPQQPAPLEHEQALDLRLDQPTATVQDRSGERIVPITRRRLRSAVEHVSWPTPLDASSSPEDADDRLRHLTAILTDATGEVPEEVLVLACREGHGQARRLALSRLARGIYRGCANTFIDALRSGDDEERSLAIDGLARLDAREALTSALNDRVDAIAARAALAVVGSRKRVDFVALLDRHVDPFRRNAILECLAGLIE